MNYTECERIAAAAVALVGRLDRMTTDEFAVGGERKERETLLTALVDAGYLRPTVVPPKANPKS